MVPFLIPAGDLPFANGDYIFIPDIHKAIEDKLTTIPAYVIKGAEAGAAGADDAAGDAAADSTAGPAGTVGPAGVTIDAFDLQLGELTDDEREIIIKGCLINYNRV